MSNSSKPNQTYIELLSEHDTCALWQLLLLLLDQHSLVTNSMHAPLLPVCCPAPAAAQGQAMPAHQHPAAAAPSGTCTNKSCAL
jgi:hypothetical protein